MNFQEIKFSFIDFETQGIAHNPKEFALVNSTGNKITEHYEIILKPNETLKNYWTKINEKLNSRIIIAHNLGFDKAILIKEFPFFPSNRFFRYSRVIQKVF